MAYMSDDLPASIMREIRNAWTRRPRRPPRRRNKHKARPRHERAMDDIQVFKPEVVPKNEVVLGVYGSLDWIFSNASRERHLAGKQTLELNITYLTPAEFKLSDWVIGQAFKSFTFFEATIVLIPFLNGYIQVRGSKGKIDVTISGDVEFCKGYERKFDEQFKRAENLIEWVYNQRGDEISVPLNYRPALTSAYPWLQKPVLEYIDDYINSDASVLILIGPPGTGKTTFIKNLIHRAGGNAKVAYDEKILAGDDFFAGFIESESNFLIMEDADSFLDSRQDGNTMMHKFLNLSDGLISAADKKLVFSTNLPNVSDIDSALLRGGRCFDVVHFRPLSRAEAQNVLDEADVDRDLPDGAEITLADLFNSQPSSSSRRKGGVGFIR